MVREVAQTSQSSLARAVGGLRAQLLRGDFTRPVAELVAFVATEEPLLSERDALIMVAAAAAAAKEVTHLQHNLELLRQHPGSTQTAEHRLARKLSYLSMGPNWDGVDRASFLDIDAMMAFLDNGNLQGGLADPESLGTEIPRPTPATACGPAQLMDLAPPADMGSIFAASPAATPRQHPSASVDQPKQLSASSSVERAAAREQLAQAPWCRRTQASTSSARSQIPPGQSADAVPDSAATAQAQPTENGHASPNPAPRDYSCGRSDCSASEGSCSCSSSDGEPEAEREVPLASPDRHAGEGHDIPPSTPRLNAEPGKRSSATTAEDQPRQKSAASAGRSSGSPQRGTAARVIDRGAKPDAASRGTQPPEASRRAAPRPKDRSAGSQSGYHKADADGQHHRRAYDGRRSRYDRHDAYTRGRPRSRSPHSDRRRDRK